MRNWKKGFRKTPAAISSKIQELTSNDIKVFAGKRITQEEVDNGVYDHLSLTSKNLEVGKSWEIVPNRTIGISSKRNLEGWTTTRKDLPKYTKYFYQDIQIFGNAARNGWTTAAIPREVYEQDVTPPYLFHIEIEVQEQQADGTFGITFSIDEIFSKSSTDFEKDLLFALNLLQENTGVSGVAEANNPEFIFTSALNWDVFPPGNLDEVINAISAHQRTRVEIDLDIVRERLELFEQFEPIEYLRGLGGNDHYIGAKYADNLVAFENLKYGNALYVLYDDWRELSQKPRSELLKLSSRKFDRIVHNQGWENSFAKLMQTEFQQRGLRVRVGRNTRRRR